MSRRRVIDVLIVLLVLSLVATVFRYHSDVEAQFTADDDARIVLGRLHDRMVVRAALEKVERTATGYPLEVPAEWFADGLPRNPLVPLEQPWLEIAPPGDVSEDPKDPVVYHRGQAGIWYNPERGILRARVVPKFSAEETLSLYNRVNGAYLTSLPRSPGEAVDEAATPEDYPHARSGERATMPDVVTPTEDVPHQTEAPPEPQMPQFDTPASGPGKTSQRPTLNDHRSQSEN